MQQMGSKGNIQDADWAREKADGTVATVGLIKVPNGGMNIVAEEVE